VPRQHDRANQITDVTCNGAYWAAVTQDAPGNMTVAGSVADVSTSHAFRYDAWNRLTTAYDGSDEIYMEYRYDGLGRRIRDRRPYSLGTWMAKEYYYNASWQLLETRADPSGGSPFQLLATSPEEQYVWSLRYIDSPVLRDRNADANNSTGILGKASSGLEERLYYQTDASMNVTALVNPSGTVVERYTYSPYGNVTRYSGAWAVWLEGGSSGTDGLARPARLCPDQVSHQVPMPR
jgi:hypothetical protein